MRHVVGVAVILALFDGAALAVRANEQQPTQVPGAFRSRVAVIPVDVRVLDRDGKPVTDLKQEDFTISEDGIVQEIRHFSAQTLAPTAPAPDAKPQFRTAGTMAPTPQNHRIFLIVLGRGRLQPPAKGVDAMIGFVRQRLLPQDQVAVLAYNRATDFTTDHEKVAQVLERFKREHERIEADLRQYFSGLSAVYGTRTIPLNIQLDIDRVFRGQGALGYRQIPPGQVTDSTRIADDVRRQTEVLQRAELLRERTGEFAGLPDPSVVREAEMIDVPFEEYVERNVDTMQDLGNIYTGIEYLRYLEGEKHLVFVTERGLFLPRLENDKSVAALASDARVVIDTIQTGGLPGGPPMSPRLGAPAPLPGPSFSQTFAVGTLRTIAELTGGQASAYRYASTAIERVDRATRFHYLLGYYPSNPTLDGRYRRITVKVNRPGVTVLFRHGYYSHQQLVPFDRREFLTYSRVTAAARYPEEVSDLKLTAKASLVQAAGSSEVVIEGKIDPSRVSFTQTENRRVGSIEVAVFCADRNDHVVGATWQKVDLTLTDDAHKRAMEIGFSYSLRVPVTTRPRHVKVIVYDPAADLVGSVTTKIP